jgi:hypothetical protein
MTVQMQARSSTTGLLYTWTTASADYAGAGYATAGHPGSPLDIIQSSAPASGVAGPAGAPGNIPAVDLIATSNVASRSGTQTIDGGSTANKRIVLVGQTASAENGTYFATAGGAWVNDFTSDADVAGAVGRPIFVKPGGTSVPAEGFNFQLIAGTTLAGAKTYARIQSAGSRVPVRAVQTADLPAHTVALLTLTATSNGALSTTVFDSIASLAVGDRYEVNSGGVAHARNGVYTLTQAGSGGTPWILTRSTDLDSSADFAAGAAYDVLDGAKYKATRRQLMTQGAIVLGTTALDFDAVREKDHLRTDISKWPSNCRATNILSTGGTTGAGEPPLKLAGAALNQALWDAHLLGAVGAGTVVQLGPGAYGVEAPVFQPGYTTLAGAAAGRTQLVPINWSGGTVLNQCVPEPPVIGGTVVDTQGDQPLEMRPAVMTGTGYNSIWYFDVTADAGIFYAGTPGFNFRAIVRQKTAGSGSSAGHIASIRGSMGSGLTAGVMHHIYTDIASTNDIVTAKLRTLDNVNPFLAAGPGAPPAVFPSGTPSNVDVMPSLHIEITDVSAGTGRGQAKFKYSTDMGITWNSDPTTDLKDITIPAGGVYAVVGNPLGVSINFPVGVYAVGQTWTNIRTTVLTSVTPMVLGRNYEICHTYDGTTTKLYINRTDVPTVDPAPQSAAQTGKVWQQDCETCLVAGPLNTNGITNDVQLGYPADMYLGSFCYGDVAISATTVNPHAFGTWFNAAGQKALFCGQSSAATTGPDGLLRHWRGFGVGGGYMYWIPRRLNSSDVKKTHLRDIEIACGLTRCSAIYTGWANEGCTWQRITLTGNGSNGWTMAGGLGFYNQGHSDIYIRNTGQYGMRISKGDISIHNLLLAGPRMPFFAHLAHLVGTGVWFSDGQGNISSLMVLSECYGTIQDLSLSDESANGARHMTAALIVSVFATPPGELSLLNGSIGMQNRTPFLLNAFIDAASGRLAVGLAFRFGTRPSDEVKIIGNPKPIRALPGFRRNSASGPALGSFIDKEGYWIGIDGRVAPTVLDAAALTSATVLTAALDSDGNSMVNCYTIAAGQVAALDAVRLAGGVDSTEWRITLQGTQANDLLVKNDASGATIDTIPMNTRGTFTYRRSSPTTIGQV